MTLRKDGPRFFPWAAFVFLVLSLSSCWTLPEEPFPDIVNWLPPDSSLILSLDVQGNYELVDLAARILDIDDDTVSKFEERASRIVLALETDVLDSDRPLGFHAAAIGAWPRNFIGSILGGQWKRSKAGKRRWEGPDGLELIFVTQEELILSHGQGDLMLSRRRESRKSVEWARITEISDGADLLLWTTDDDFIRNMIPSISEDRRAKPVIQKMALSLWQNDGDYDVQIALFPQDVQMIRILTLGLRLALSNRLISSGDPLERELFSKLEFAVNGGAMLIRFPKVEMEVLEGFITESLVFLGLVP